MLETQKEMMAEMLKQDVVLRAQDMVLAEQTGMLKEQLLLLRTSRA